MMDSTEFYLDVHIVVGHAAPADRDGRQAGVGAIRGRPQLPPAGDALRGLLIADRADDARPRAAAGRRGGGGGGAPPPPPVRV